MPLAHLFQKKNNCWCAMEADKVVFGPVWLCRQTGSAEEAAPIISQMLAEVTQ